MWSGLESASGEEGLRETWNRERKGGSYSQTLLRCEAPNRPQGSLLRTMALVLGSETKELAFLGI